ncbi:hypothetical protein DJ82_13535 [Halorubrum sp. Ib24]|uniref:hypothetical protein n=1 Tax=unclassified Halorubrum TaxID=2642239 RepID=UPI000B988C72|nr:MULTISPECIES: hypothetical protein [unclassified Halorubrum]OYR37961.1 hypothetical protein DJ82_13535 [Halorubrum sp. Ib24]OYR42267.1 hypothetical protein DJ81_11435 [Halorubrum sp. Hd13]OYR49963.1 hypothetical protein DJ75_00470 [Halorubrum sp. Eb13]OYR51174.1 hypothetical protein DJ74_04545 [Halorubrum sp. Ea8]OYR53437.1 hypothetical protein DJ73_07365 [Halorubrum sp. Ea1]
MRPDGTRTRRDASNPPRGPPPTVRGSALLVAAMLGVLVAASYPVASAGVASAALAVYYGARPIARRLRKRADDWDPRPVCVPGTGVCLGA